MSPTLLHSGQTHICPQVWWKQPSPASRELAPHPAPRPSPVPGCPHLCSWTDFDAPPRPARPFTNTQVHAHEVRPTQPLVAPSPARASSLLLPQPPQARLGRERSRGGGRGAPRRGAAASPSPGRKIGGAEAAGEGTEARQGGLLIVREILFLTDAKADGTELTENGRGKKRKNITGSRESGH